MRKLALAAFALLLAGTAHAETITVAGGGSSLPCTTTALSVQYNNAGALGCVLGAVSDGSKITFTQAPIVNLNTTAPTITGGATIQLTGAAATTNFLELNSFGASSGILARRADGTSASPTTVQSGDVLAFLTARPYDGTGYLSTGSGNLEITASENFSGTNHGTDVVVKCDAITTVTVAECARFKSSGLTIPTGSTYQINGTQITSAALSDSALLARLASPTFSGTVTFPDSTTVTSSGHSALTESGGALTLSGNQSVAAWTTSGVRLKGVSGTLTDTTSSGTVAAAYTDVLGGNTIAASSAATFTKYVSLHVNAPVVGTNVTITNPFALEADSLSVGTSGIFKVSLAGVLTTTGAQLTTPTLGVFAGTSGALGGATIGSNALAVTGTSLLTGTLQIVVASGNTSQQIQFGGATSSFPSLSRNSATLGATRADGGAYVDFYAGQFNLGQLNTGAGAYRLGSPGLVAWTSATANPNDSGTVDTTISRKSAGIVQINSGTGAGDGGTLDAGAYQAGGVAGVSCSANSVTLLTEVVTNGIVTHC